MSRLTFTVEPAFRAYWFDQAVPQVIGTFRSSFRLNFKTAVHYWKADYRETLQQRLPLVLVAPAMVVGFVFRLATCLSVIWIGTLVTSVLCVLHALVAVTCGAVATLIFLSVWSAERCLYTVRGWIVICPGCGQHYGLPVYRCSQCHAEHRRLIPSQFGILYRKCRCRQMLPSSVFTGRNRLQSFCPACNLALTDTHLSATKSLVLLLGAPDAGKSTFLVSLVHTLVETELPEKGLKAEFIPPKAGELISQRAEDLKQGIPLPKTRDLVPKAVNLLIPQKNLLLYLYDPAGEAMFSAEQLKAHEYLNFFSGAILLVDPFKLPALSHLLPQQDQAAKSIQPVEIVNHFLSALEQQFGLDPATGLVQQPLAVVIIKMDKLLRSLKGKEEREAMQVSSGLSRDLTQWLQRPEPGKNAGTHAAASGAFLQELLLKWEQHELIQQLNRFAHVQFFACWAAWPKQKDKDQEKRIAPRGVTAPFRWILQQGSLRQHL
ncbi:MAG: hypothetical protein ACKO2P_14685 [Planctomycetota bacterium]